MVKGKGSDYEREICRKLSQWWSEWNRDDLFWRSAGSGAMAKTRSRKGMKTFGQYGDVQATDPAGQPLLDAFTIELKRGYSYASLIDMLDRRDQAAKQLCEIFFRQVLQDFTNAGSAAWMLIWRRDRRDALVYLPNWAMVRIIEVGDVGVIPYLRGKVRLKSGDLIWVFVCRLDDFLHSVQPKDIVAALLETR